MIVSCHTIILNDNHKIPLNASNLNMHLQIDTNPY